MPAYTNFFENVKEADMRLKGTVVLYDGDPYYVLCITDHKPDGIYRIYMEPTGHPNGLLCSKPGTGGIPCGSSWDVGTYGSNRGVAMDKWLDVSPGTRVIRKMMNSPAFNKFRPFPLGMVNKGGSVVYAIRQPLRKSEQGLTGNMLDTTSLSLFGGKGISRSTETWTPEFAATIKGEYPTAHECLTQLKNPETANEAAAFHREFALLRGPVDTLFLAYKQDVVGLLPSASFASVKLGKKFGYVKEAVESLGIFSTVHT